MTQCSRRRTRLRVLPSSSHYISVRIADDSNARLVKRVLVHRTMSCSPFPTHVSDQAEQPRLGVAAVRGVFQSGVPYSGVGREDCWLFFLKHFVIFLSLSRTALHSRVVSRQRVDDRGIMALFPSGTNHPNRPDRPWSPPSLLNNEYWELWVRRL